MKYRRTKMGFFDYITKSTVNDKLYLHPHSLCLTHFQNYFHSYPYHITSGIRSKIETCTTASSCFHCCIRHPLPPPVIALVPVALHAPPFMDGRHGLSYHYVASANFTLPSDITPLQLHHDFCWSSFGSTIRKTYHCYIFESHHCFKKRTQYESMTLNGL